MIENNNPEINVDELMNKIRDEVARRCRSITTSPPNRNGPANTSFSFNWPQIMASLSMAEQSADAGSTVSPMLRFRKAVRWLARLTGRIVIYLARLVTVPQRRFNHSILQAVWVTVDGARNMSQGLAECDSRIAEMEGSLTERDNRIARLEESMTRGLAERDSRIAEMEGSLTERDNCIAGVEESVNQGLAERDSRIAEMEGSLTERDNRIAGVEESVNQGLAERDSRIAGLEKTITYLRTNLIFQDRRLSMLLEEARKRLPEPFDEEQLQTYAKEEAHLLDPLYTPFQDQFYATREHIKDLRKVYLAFIREAKVGTEKRPILDVACGRGEWLELLKEEGLTARGIDLNRVLIEQCMECGLDVVEGDLIEYLQNVRDASLGAVTGFHIIEHLPFGVLIKLLDETVRVLKPGGLAIFETPNPENILVGACNFYLDPTHCKPLPAPMIKFLVESRGLCRVEIIRLHPYNEAFKLPDDGSELTKRFNEFFHGPQDYAIVGRRL